MIFRNLEKNLVVGALTSDMTEISCVKDWKVTLDHENGNILRKNGFEFKFAYMYTLYTCSFSCQTFKLNSVLKILKINCQWKYEILLKFEFCLFFKINSNELIWEMELHV